MTISRPIIRMSASNTIVTPNSVDRHPQKICGQIISAHRVSLYRCTRTSRLNQQMQQVVATPDVRREDMNIEARTMDSCKAMQTSHLAQWMVKTTQVILFASDAWTEKGQTRKHAKKLFLNTKMLHCAMLRTETNSV